MIDFPIQNLPTVQEYSIEHKELTLCSETAKHKISELDLSFYDVLGGSCSGEASSSVSRPSV